MTLIAHSPVASGQARFDTDIRDLAVLPGPGGGVLYAITGQSGGASVYRIAPDGAVTPWDTALFSDVGLSLAQPQLAQFEQGADTLVLVGVSSQGDLWGYRLLPDFSLGAVQNVTSLAGEIAAWTLLGDDRLYLRDASGALYSSDGSFLGVDLPADSQLAPGPTGRFLAAAGSVSQITGYQVFADGSVQSSADVDASDGLSISGPVSAANVMAHGTGWTVVAAAGSDTLSVLRHDPAAGLMLTDHLLDTRETRFGGVQDIAAIETEDGRALIFAGGADDGIAVFELLPDGRLTHLHSQPHMPGSGLENVTALAAQRLSDSVALFVASQGDTGLAHLTWSLADQGGLIGPENAIGGGLTGTIQDDILLSGPGASVLTGGAGSDLFVIRPGAANQQITDFDVQTDRLDLSQLGLLRSPGQIVSTRTETALILEIGSVSLTLSAENTPPPSVTDLWPNGRFATPDRLLFDGTLSYPAPPPAPPDDPPVIFDGVVLTGRAVADTLTGTDLNDDLSGGGGRDMLLGRAGNDRLSGEARADEIWAGSGNDTIFGGDGNDTIGSFTGDDIVNGGPGNDLVWAGPGRDRVEGGDGADELWAISGDDTVLGGSGDDRLGGADGQDSVVGGSGNDELNGGTGDDVLLGETGNDSLWGNTGNDRIEGGNGNDVIGAFRGDDYILAGAGNDEVWAGPDRDTVLGGDGSDSLWGLDGADTVQGGADDDTLGGGSGTDRIEGGLGNDLIYGGGAADTIWGGDGQDLIWAMDASDTVYGGAGDDTIGGGSENDQLFGESGADSLTGGVGDDSLFGGAGDDILTGTGGRDSFVFGVAHGQDRITDFDPDSDRIDFRPAGLGPGSVTLTVLADGVRLDSAQGSIVVDGPISQPVGSWDLLFV